VYASDRGDGEAQRAVAEEIRRLGGDAETGGHDLAKLAACTRIVLSPGIPPTAPVLRAPEIAGVKVIPEMEFGWEQLDVPTIAVTGTNGKTTTTALVAHLLESCGVRAVAAGNIGTALSEVALSSPQPEVVALEASSFQLGGVERFAPEIGVLTNLSPDHLDWYPDVRSYYEDKKRLFLNATEGSRWVLNGEDDEVRALPGDAPGERYWFRIDGPLAEGERGAFLASDGRLTLALGGGEEPLLDAGELRILGRHNVANALAAAIAVRLSGGEPACIADGLRSFGSLPHRMEPIGERRGVLWINDSKATNVASTRVGLRSLDRPTILLLGGRHKGEPYAGLIPDMTGRVRRVLAYGEAGERIERDLRGRVPVERVEGPFEAVVRRAAQVAHPGDAVLLSPACSSYDMFTSYEERGRRFRELVSQEEK
jgi:UDP-N-acetylmuramoylalanine--D-glutamate ligase